MNELSRLETITIRCLNPLLQAVLFLENSMQYSISLPLFLFGIE